MRIRNLGFVVYSIFISGIVILSTCLIGYASMSLPFMIGLFGIILLILYIILEYNLKVVLFLLFLNLFLSFYAYTAFPARSFFALNNFPILSLINFLCMILFFLESKTQRIKFATKTQYILLMSFSFLLVYSSFITKDLFLLDGFSKIFLLVSSGVLFTKIIYSVYFQNKEYIYYFLKFLVYLGIFCGLAGFVTYFTGINNYFVEEGLTFSENYQITSVSIFTHPNATATIYNFCIPPALFFLFFKKDKIGKSEKLLFISGIIIMSFSLLLTFSRSSIFSILVIFLIMTFYYSRKLFYLFLIILPVIFLDFASGFFESKGSGTIITRMGLLATTYVLLNKININFFWGYGAVSYKSIFEVTKMFLGVYDSNNNPHNILLFFALMFGFIPLIPLFLYVLIIFIKSTIRMFKQPPSLLILSYCVCMPLIMKNMFEDLLIFPEFIQYPLFLIFWGLILIAINNKNSFYEKFIN